MSVALDAVRAAARDGTGPRVSIAVTSPAALVRVSGDVDVGIVPALRTTLDNAVALRPFVIVDLTAAGTIVPDGLGTLIRARTASRRRGGELLLAAPYQVVRTTLWSMRLHTVFRIFDSVPEAITAALTLPDPASERAGAPDVSLGPRR
jgi:anti-anti-sigma factor